MQAEKERDPKVMSLSGREDVALSKSEVKRHSEEKVGSSVLARLGMIRRQNNWDYVSGRQSDMQD